MPGQRSCPQQTAAGKRRWQARQTAPTAGRSRRLPPLSRLLSIRPPFPAPPAAIGVPEPAHCGHWAGGSAHGGSNAHLVYAWRRRVRWVPTRAFTRLSSYYLLLQVTVLLPCVAAACPVPSNTGYLRRRHAGQTLPRYRSWAQHAVPSYTPTQPFWSRHCPAGKAAHWAYKEKPSGAPGAAVSAPSAALASTASVSSMDEAGTVQAGQPVLHIGAGEQRGCGDWLAAAGTGDVVTWA